MCVTVIQFVWNAVQLLAAHLCRLTESALVFVTAESLCPSAKTRDTAANNSFHNGSVPINCDNGPNIQISIDFFKVQANPILVFVHSDKKVIRTRDRPTAEHQLRYSVDSTERIWIFVVLFPASTRWQTAGKVCLLHSGQFPAQHVWDKKGQMTQANSFS